MVLGSSRTRGSSGYSALRLVSMASSISTNLLQMLYSISCIHTLAGNRESSPPFETSAEHLVLAISPPSLAPSPQLLDSSSSTFAVSCARFEAVAMIQFAAAELAASYAGVFLFGEHFQCSDFRIQLARFSSARHLWHRSGIYTVIFAICVWHLLRARKVNLILLIVAIIEYTLSFTYIALNLRNIATSYIPNPEIPTIVVFEAHPISDLTKAMNWVYIFGVRRVS